jgi:hypothetical protein
MTHLRSALLVFLVGAALCPLHAATDEEVASRRVALDLAGAFSNDHFKLRDGCWTGHLAAKESRILQVNLYAGNQYWFSAGTTAAAGKLAVSVHDESGQPVPYDPFAEAGKAAAGFAPTVSGPYYIRVENSGPAPITFCLVYSYK